MSDDIITVATNNNQFFKIKQSVYNKLNRDFNDGNNLDLSVYSKLFSLTKRNGFSIEDSLEAALVTDTLYTNDLTALGEYLLSPVHSRQALYAEKLLALNTNKHNLPNSPRKQTEPHAIRKKMQDIVFAYIKQSQRTILPADDPFYIIPFDVKNLILEFYSRRFKYKTDFDTNGIVYWLGCNYGTSPTWMNPSLCGLVEVTASSVMQDSKPLYSVVGDEVVRCVTRPIADQWIMIEFMDIAIIPTHYALRHYNTWDVEALRNWSLQARNNNLVDDDWEVLSRHVGDTSLHKRGATHTWKIPKKQVSKAFSQFRIYQFGVNSNNHHYLALSGFEIYGTITTRRDVNNRDVINTRGQVSGILPKKHKLARGFRRNFEYCYDFDCNGLFYLMGVVGGTGTKHLCYANPAKLGVVEVTSCGLVDDDQQLWNAIVGRKSLNCRTTLRQNKPWIAVDLKGVKIKLTAYTLRHYISFDTEALRYWNLEGSNNGIRWTIIKQHLNDKSLFQAGQSHTWRVAADEYFSHFRIFMFDRNSNNDLYILACSGMELYGNAFGGIVSQYYDLDIKQESEGWTCDICTFVNSSDRINCEMCNAPEPDINLDTYGWDTLKRSDALQISDNGSVVTNLADDFSFRSIVSNVVLEQGKHSFEIHIMNASSQNKFIVGVAPMEFNPKEDDGEYVGWKGSWGYVCNGVMSHEGKPMAQSGDQFGRNDRIKCIVNCDKHTLEFYKNDSSQGIAFSNLIGSLSPAVTLCGKDASVKITNVNLFI
eukprot:23029_1